MKKIIIRNVLILCLLMSAGFYVQAAEISQGLLAVNNISHPSSNRYAAGQPEPESFSVFAAAGVKHVINLRPPAETANINEAAIVTKAGMAYYNVPIGGGADLTRDNVILIDKLLSQIGEESVLLHCSSSNRVGAVMALRAAWLEGASAGEAIAIGKRWGLTRMQPSVERLLAQ